ncbi:ribonuclease M5 [Bacillus coahuilensis p1.1.43]|uniref:Ribonuclease M5 n=1 Tax=Bacillus coahuilensis p1.1.43 TaxID=1150625 RepID=A0A147K4Y1_9BACI|nr:ribonuclease M5 [Bacillus coahuilensis]KUP04569.1 ribonuclease M5 [Bacillus coahuilensis p1.1.43]
MKIKEIIVVEGKDDTVAVQQAVNADTIETNGSAISSETIEKIKHAQEKRGVIILTDPDYPGQKIRKTIEQAVPGCKHAFIPREEAYGRNRKGVGVEHASKGSIQEALRHALTMEAPTESFITKEDLLDAGLVAGPGSKARRERLGTKLRIGYINGKQLYQRLTMFQISKEEFSSAVQEIIEEEQAE